MILATLRGSISWCFAHWPGTARAATTKSI
ncbi:hypothetical protein FHY05_004530 [Sphingomonas sp. BK580]|nr:hypothetical protein [Sphingomonas sp. BK580]